jgi:hypothetical protein
MQRNLKPEIFSAVERATRIQRALDFIQSEYGAATSQLFFVSAPEAESIDPQK